MGASPEVKLLDSNGSPIRNYRAMVRAVDGPTDDANPLETVRFDIGTMTADNPRRIFDSPLGTRLGTRADEDGISIQIDSVCWCII